MRRIQQLYTNSDVTIVARPTSKIDIARIDEQQVSKTDQLTLVC